MKKTETLFWGVALCGLVLGGCRSESAGVGTDREIVFQTATSYENNGGTRTVYSGEMVENRAFERIDWVPGEDRVRILSPEAEDGPQQDYRITEIRNESRYSNASVEAVNEKLRWGKGTHHFFGLYPAPGMSSSVGGTVSEEDASITMAADGKTAVVKGRLLPEQKGKWDGRIFRPDMNHAYMGAATSASEGEQVVLSFLPLVTTLEFNLHAVDESIAEAKLVSLDLVSESTPLTGSFTTVLSVDNTHSNPVLDNTGKEVHIDLDGGIQLSQNKNESTRITVLTLPVDQKDLSARMNFQAADGTTFSRALPLRTKEVESITIPACRKVYIWNLGVPEGPVDYSFEVLGDLENCKASGETRDYQVSSSKTQYGQAHPLGWTVQFSQTEEGPYGDEFPEWMDGMTVREETGSVEPKEYAVSLLLNPEYSTLGWPAMGENRVQDKAVDLSLLDGVHDTRGTGRRTANCYVVTAPGWYKFPAVYGNALDEVHFSSGDNQAAYSYVDEKGVIHHDLDFTPFLDCNDQAIKTPWILADTGTKRAEALLCWQDREGLLDAGKVVFSAEEQNLYIYVDPARMGQGNAVVALREADGAKRILWSWHIWVANPTGNNLRTTTIGINRTYHDKSPILSHDLLNVTVGWCDPEHFKAEPRTGWVRFTQDESGKTVTLPVSQSGSESRTYANTPYYQWGRKDPMLPGSGETEKDDKDQFGPFPWSIHKGHAETIGEAIQHPYYFYDNQTSTGASEGKGTWFSTFLPDSQTETYGKSHHSFWDSGMGSRHAGNVMEEYKLDRKGIKTVYDPCPVGYQVPDLLAFTVFSSSPEVPEKEEHTIKFFNSPDPPFHDGCYWFYAQPDKEGALVRVPAQGYREKGPLKNYGLKAYYWTAATSGSANHDAHRLYVEVGSNSRIHPMSEWYIQQAYPIRPIVEWTHERLYNK